MLSALVSEGLESNIVPCAAPSAMDRATFEYCSNGVQKLRKHAELIPCNLLNFEEEKRQSFILR